MQSSERSLNELPPALPKPLTLARARMGLGTLIEISVHSNFDENYTHQCLELAFSACQRVENAMSHFLPDSDITRFNLAEAGTTLTCDPWTIQVLKAAQYLQKRSDYLFDISMGTTPFPSLAYTILNPSKVVKHFTASQLNVGGIAKGYAVDRMVATLRAHGIKNGCINAGGDLRCFGKLAWPIYKRQHSGSTSLTPWMMISNGSVASSEFHQGRSPLKHDTLYCPPSSTSLAPQNNDSWVAVAARRCLWADALSKVVALTGNNKHPALSDFGAQAWMETKTA